VLIPHWGRWKEVEKASLCISGLLSTLTSIDGTHTAKKAGEREREREREKERGARTHALTRARAHTHTHNRV
jgi:hypothetical protein